MNSDRFLKARNLAAALFCLCLAVSASAASAQEYPNRFIRIVVGFPPGGGVDTVARIVAAEISKGLGQSVVVENKPGAAGTIGAATVAKSDPDGYTLLMTPGGHALFGAVFGSLPFDTVGSFDWISSIMTLPFFAVVPAGSPIQSLSDLVATAKSAPGTITYGSAGPGSTHHLAVELLAHATGVKFQHVPYRGDGPLITALLAGEVQFSLATPTQVIANVQANKLRALAVTANARAPALPAVPTAEQALGLKDFDVRTWFALAGPAGMPKTVVGRLNAELRKALDAPEVRERLAAIGGEVGATTPGDLHDRVARELAMWTRVVETAGIPKQ